MALRFVDDRTLIAALDPNDTRTWDLPTRRLVAETRGTRLQEGPVFDYHQKPHALSKNGRLLAAARTGRGADRAQQGEPEQLRVVLARPYGHEGDTALLTRPVGPRVQQ